MKKETIGSIVTSDIRTANVFKKYGLDFCCGGGEKLEEACLNKNISVEDVISDLQLSVKEEKLLVDFQKMPLNELVDYIFQKHHFRKAASWHLKQFDLLLLARLHQEPLFQLFVSMNLK